MNDNEDEIYLAAYRWFEQRDGNPIFRAAFAPAGRGRVFREGLVVQRQYRLNFEQLRDAEGEVLCEALTEAITSRKVDFRARTRDP